MDRAPARAPARRPTCGERHSSSSWTTCYTGPAPRTAVNSCGDGRAPHPRFRQPSGRRIRRRRPVARRAAPGSWTRTRHARCQDSRWLSRPGDRTPRPDPPPDRHARGECAGSISSSSPANMVDLERRVAQVERVVEHRSRPRRAAWQSPRADEHVGRERGEARGDLPDVESWTSTTPGCEAERDGRSRSGSRPGRRRLEEHPRRTPTQPVAGRSIRPATSSEAIGSARSKPVSRMMPAAIAVPMNA